jgi:hypothetical protein
VLGASGDNRKMFVALKSVRECVCVFGVMLSNVCASLYGRVCRTIAFDLRR